MDVVNGHYELVSIVTRDLLSEATSMLEVVEHLPAFCQFAHNHCNATFLFTLAQNSTFLIVDNFADVRVL